MRVLKQSFISGLLLLGLSLPLAMMADANASQCGDQPYDALLKTCLQPGGNAQSVITACSAIIKNNCLSLDSTTSPTLQLAAIHQAMVAAFAANPGSNPPPAVGASDQATQASMQDTNSTDTPVIHHYVQASQDVPKPQKLTQPTPKTQNTNFWF